MSVFDLFDQLNRWYDEPFGDLSALPTSRVCELARSRSTVALSGDGGDELFGGYRWYQRFWRFHRFNRAFRHVSSRNVPFRRPPANFWQKIVNRVALFAQFDPLNLYSGVMSNMLTAELKPVREWLGVSADYDYLWSLRPHYFPELGRYKALQYLDFHTFLPDDILVKVDRVSMAVSLEVRVPFLSRRLCELAFSLPESFVWQGGEPKGGLKAAYRDRLPAEILARDKRGFSVPVDWWKQDLLDGEPNCVYYYLACLRNRGLESIRP